MKITINEKQYGFEWGLGAIEIFCDNNDCDISDIDVMITSNRQIEQMKAINQLFLAAIKNWCLLQLPKVEFDVTYPMLQRAITAMKQEDYNAILDDWKKSQFFGKTIAEYYFGETPATEQPKKKSRSEKS